MSTIEVKVPDIGDFTDVPVIESCEARRHRRRRGFARHARIRQGDDGRAVARRGHGEGTAGQARRQGQRGHVDLSCSSVRMAPPRATPATASRRRAAPHAATRTRPRHRLRRPNAAHRRPAIAPDIRVTPPAVAHARPHRAASAGGRPSTASVVQGRARVAVGAQVRARARRRSRARHAAPVRRTASCRKTCSNFVKQALSGAAHGAPRALASPAAASSNLLPWPKVDFAKFGPVETQARCRGSRRSPARTSRATG